MGTAYFADLVEQFGDVAAALAAYNAGETRVAAWRAERPGVDRDEFIDDIPFPETQNYVKRDPGDGRGLPRPLRPHPALRCERIGPLTAFRSTASRAAGRAGAVGTPLPVTRSRTSQKAARFTESVIREMTRLALRHGAVNLSQGFPDFPAPEVLKAAAAGRDCRRHEPVRRHLGRPAAPRGDCGGRGRPARVARGPGSAGHGVLRRDRGHGGDDAGHRRSGRRGDRLRAVLRELRSRRDPVGRHAAVRAAAPAGRARADWTFDPDELAAAFSNRTRAIIINTPNNPTGQGVHARGTGGDRALCAANGTSWRSPTRSTSTSSTTAPGTCRWPRSRAWRTGRSRSTALSKTFSVTGWRVGWTVAPAEITAAIRKVHDFLTVGAAAPLQAAAAAALGAPRRVPTRDLAAAYAARRTGCSASSSGRASCATRPQGAYYIMTDIVGVRISRTTWRSRGTW